jgi:hypothetical protein
MANQAVRPQNRREFMSKLIEPAYAPEYGVPEKPFSEPAKLGQPEQNRAYEISVKNDNVRDFKVGIKDFDEAIMYYFTEVLKPSVTQNNTRINVPVIYGMPENWKTVQEDGYYRDSNGKLMAPLIMFRRRSLTQNRGLGFKIDGNVARNLQLFEKRFSKRNIYSNFATLNNRNPETEYVASITPDYVTVEYDVAVWTYFVEQMDSLIESFNYASRAYWGDPNRFQFHSSIESFEESITYEIGENRAVRNNFSITLNGYIIPDSVNKSVSALNRVYGVSQIVFGLETTSGDAETISTKKLTKKSIAKASVQDSIVINNITNTFDPDVIAYLGISKQITGLYVDPVTVNFPQGWAIAPISLPPTSVQDFKFFVNGQYVEPTSIASFTDYGTYSTLVIDQIALQYNLESSDVIVGVGKFN